MWTLSWLNKVVACGEGDGQVREIVAALHESDFADSFREQHVAWA